MPSGAPSTLDYAPDTEPVRHLTHVDPVLGRLIDTIGPYSIELRSDRFEALARAIVGQQLSVSAARTIWGRFVELVGSLDPAVIVALDEDALRGVGLSRAKGLYVRDLAARVLDGRLELDRFDEMEDARVIDELVSVKGIGRWTAEMFLIFSLGRPDVFAPDDVGLQRAVRLAYGLDETTPATLVRLSEPWGPHRTAASLYLWASLDNQAL